MLGDVYQTNPAHLIEMRHRQMLPLWSAWRNGHLPDPGGVFDQAAVMVDAFDVMSAAAEQVRQARRS